MKVRKLNILKSLVDFVWIVTCIPLIGLLLFFSVFIFVDTEVIDFIFEVDDAPLDASMFSAQIFILLGVGLSFLGIYCFYLFRKTLRYFQRVKPFHIDVIDNFNRIGLLLTIIGISGAVLHFLAQLILTSQFKVYVGISPQIMITCLGLFFMVLSEVFKIAKAAKEENELTV